jgi:hypothetical protein
LPPLSAYRAAAAIEFLETLAVAARGFLDLAQRLIAVTAELPQRTRCDFGVADAQPD